MLRLKVLAAYRVVRSPIFQQVTRALASFLPHESGEEPGFETITYMLQGSMEHRDHMGNVGLLEDGGVQWMTAGRGVIHSEMPSQTEGKMRGFQLWLNLAAENKMQSAHYRDVKQAELPRYQIAATDIIAIAGDGIVNGVEINGFFQRTDTKPILWDIHLAGHSQTELALPAGMTTMIYVYDNCIALAGTEVPAQHLVRIREQDALVISNPASQSARILLIAGAALRQPVVQYGPFVMNSSEQIEQALKDYHNGVLTEA